MNKKVFKVIMSFIFIFSFVGCSCKGNTEEVKRGTIEVPQIVAYFSKNINGNYTITYPFGTYSSMIYFYESDKENIEEYYKNEYIRMHQLFDRHYYYFDENENLINNLRVLNESNGEAIKVDEDLIQIFKEGIRFTKLSKGKFNIAVGYLSDLWNSFIEIGDYLGYEDIEKLSKYNFSNGSYLKDDNGDYVYIGGAYINIKNNTDRYIINNNQFELSSEGNYIDLSNIAPSDEQIEYAKSCTPSYLDIENIIVIDDVNNTITKNNINGCNVSITLGALAKSYATEKISNDKRIKDGNFLMNSGQSTIKILGDNLTKESKNWVVAITDSHLVYKEGSYFGTYKMTIDENVSISTSSGDNEHYKCNDNYYHHIIDPISGYPYQGRFAVTSVMENAMYADIITTTLMTMNMEETKQYLKELNAQGIYSELFIQEKENNFVKAYFTKGLKDKISKVDDENYNDYINSIVIEEFNYES